MNHELSFNVYEEKTPHDHPKCNKNPQTTCNWRTEDPNEEDKEGEWGSVPGMESCQSYSRCWWSEWKRKWYAFRRRRKTEENAAKGVWRMDAAAGADDERGCIHDNVRWKMVDFSTEVGNSGRKVSKTEMTVQEAVPAWPNISPATSRVCLSLWLMGGCWVDSASIASEREKLPCERGHCVLSDRFVFFSCPKP